MRAASNSARSQLGIATTSYMMAWKPKDTLDFLEHCQRLGAAGIQSAIYGDPRALRERAEQYGMYVEAMVPMPHDSDTAEFEGALQKAQAAGAVASRTDLLGRRRYEAFKSYEEWQQHLADCHKSIEAALPLLDKYKIPLGLENHKDWTADQLADLMRKYGTQNFGVCLDFGNNISLLDDPMYVIETLSPYTVCTHVKDMAVAPCPDGFLLSEVLLGRGYLDLPRAISLVRQHRPEAKLSLEMITRDPLRVPCLTDQYWVTFPDRNGLYLARTLRFINDHPSREPLEHFSQLSHDEWIKAEDVNVIACLRYANENLGLART